MNLRQCFAVVGLCAALTAAVSSFAQTSTSTAIIKGIVLTTDETPKPVRRAIVSLWGGAHPLGHHAVSDDDGRFEFVNLPAGRYSVSASRASYVSMAYGASRPGWPGTPLALGPGDRVDNLTVLMARGAAITGTVSDSEGEVIPNLTVRVEQIDAPPVAGSTRREVRTDEHGQYRAFGLAAGRYIVSARPTPSGAAVMRELRDEEVDRLLSNLRNRSIPGKIAPASALEPVTTPLSDFVPVYHPGSFDSGEAVPIRLAPGDERTSIDILVRTMPMTEVSGQVIASAPEYLTGIELTLTRLMGRPVTERASTSILKDGRFRFSSVTPGRYRILARAIHGSGAANACLFSSAEVFVVGEPVSGLSLPLRTCPKIAGRFEFAGATTSAPASLAGIRVRLGSPAPNDATLMPSLYPPVVSTDDGRFTLGDYGELMPGQFTLLIEWPLGSSTRRWQLQSLTADGRDILDFPLEIGDDSSRTIAVTAVLTDQGSSLVGVLQDANGKPATELTVLVFPVNREWWREPFRRVRTTRPASDGAFDFADLPPGDYYLAALAEVAPSEWLDPAFLNDTANVALSLTVRHGERKVHDLRVAK